jgi:hypothetical protein
LSIDSSIDGLQLAGQILAVLPGGEIERIAQQMDDAGLHSRFCEDGIDGLGKALQAIDDGNQDVLDATVLHLVHHPQPELGPLVGFDPETEDLFCTIAAHAERDMHRFVADMAFIPDLDPQGIEEHQRIDRLQRPRLPGRHFIKHRIGDRRDQVGRHVDAVKLLDMPDDLARAHPTRIHRHDLLVEARKAALILGKQLRVEARLTVSRDRELKRAAIGQNRLAAVAIAAVASGLFTREVAIHLRVQRPLRQRLLQLIEQAIALESCLRIRTGQ